METMFLTTLLYGLMLLWPCAVLCQDCLVTAEEGYSYGVSCSNLGSIDVIRFQKKLDNAFVTVSACSSVNNTCEDFMPEHYISEIIDGRMHLDITRATINDTLFRCSIDTPQGFENSTFCVDVFVKPATPDCDQPMLVNSGTQISTTCRSEKVFPDASLVASMYRTDVADGLRVEPDCDRPSASSIFPGYKATNCSARFPLSRLEPGTYKFYLAMYPLISNITVAFRRIAESDSRFSMDLSAPGVKLSDECPSENNYIASGNCTCQLTTQGKPPGQARWYTQTGQVAGFENPEDRSSTLSVSYYQSGPTPTYECRADTVLNVTSPSKVSFAPRLAYGPLNLTFESFEGGAFDLCPNEELTTKVTCKVPIKDVEPRGVNFIIKVNKITALDQAQGSIFGNNFVRDYSFRPSTGGGKYVVTCRAENTISSELNMEKDLPLEVREPPTSAPVLLVTGNEAGSKLAKVTLGQKTDVTCKVDGGYPQVSQVTIKCGSRLLAQTEGKIASLALEVTKDVDGLVCHCLAQHVTGCYDAESEVKLQVEESSDQTTSIIIGLSVTAAAAVIVAIVIVFMFFYMRRTPKTPELTKNPQPSLPVISYHVPQLSQGNGSDGYVTATNPYNFIGEDGTIPSDSAGYIRPGVADNSSYGYITALDHYDFIGDDENIPTDDEGYYRSVSDDDATAYDNSVPSV